MHLVRRGGALVCSCGATAVRLLDGAGDEIVVVLADVAEQIAAPA